MMRKPNFALVFGKTRASMARFRDDESGSMALIIIFTFLIMILFGGIAVDVMRFETRRVAMQQTLDRAALAAAKLPDDIATARTPNAIAADWFTKAGLGADLAMVEFSAPTVTAVNIPGRREVTISASVRSYNFFMGMFSTNDYLQGPTSTKAAQGVSNIEVMLVLDVTGSMGSSLSPGKSKIQALREAATSFVNIVKTNDTKNGVSIGMVPYAAQVNIPVALRDEFNVVNISSWNGVANVGVPNIACLELPVSSYGSTALSLTDPIPMAAVADSNNGTDTTTNYLAPGGFQPNAASRACTTVADNPATLRNEATANQIVFPTKDGTVLTGVTAGDGTVLVPGAISGLVAAGNTNIAIGMRWASALLDEAARPIYTSIGDASVQGRPADNDSGTTRKIIILMTDGQHVSNNHVLDAFKSGPSPIWRGADGRYAMRFWADGGWHNDNARPACAGANEYFVPHLQPTGTCVAAAWRSAPSWDGSGAVTRLDWSEVWRYLRVSYVARQFYLRSNIADMPTYNSLMNSMRASYLTSPGNMNTLLQQNCTAARDAGIELYGIAFAAGAVGAGQIEGCASEPKTTYFYNAANNADLLAAFNQIATDISDLRLTQ